MIELFLVIALLALYVTLIALYAMSQVAAHYKDYSRKLYLRYRFIVDECGEPAKAADARWERISAEQTTDAAADQA